MKLAPLNPALLAFGGLTSLLSAAPIWVEGESTSASTMKRHPWYDSVKADVLSEGAWLSHFQGGQTGEASYDLEVPEKGGYRFWIRANPLGNLSYRIGELGPFKAMDLKTGKRGEQNIASDGKPDLRFVAWFDAGKVELEKGSQKLTLQIAGESNGHGAVDCFVLTNEPFSPQGTMKPGAAGAVAVIEADPKDAIWIEGEAATRATVARSPWWYDQVKKDVLSGNDFISNFGKSEGLAEYEFEAIEADTYTFWIRANSLATSLSWQLDNGEWQLVDFKEKRGEQNIAADSKPDLRFIAWVKPGQVKLTAGKHVMKFKFHSKSDNHGSLDCFVLTRIPFIPNGAAKPMFTRAVAAKPGDWFPLLADDDTFAAGSVIDMTNLTEAPAGKQGPITAKGSELVYANKPRQAIKLWGVNSSAETAQNHTHELQIQRIRYLRKFGINYVRQHTVFDDVSTDGKIDSKKLDAYDWWFAELKKAGIYSNWGLFYHFPIRAADGYDAMLFAELPEAGEKGQGLRDSYGFISFSEDLWRIRNKVMVELLNHKNPYTGLTYAEDPALAVVEMQNEDSVFFHNPLSSLASLDCKTPLHAKLLRQKWAVWVKAKYVTDDAVEKAWGKLDGESLANGELALMAPWELGMTGPEGKFKGQLKRAGDYIEFLHALTRGLYVDCEKVIRGTGYKSLTITTNWLAGNASSDFANIEADTVGSMIDRHNYAGGGAGGHNVGEGGVYADSHLGKPGQYLFSIGLKQVGDKPFSMTEWTMCPPNQWKHECAPLFAFYGMALQGWDASCHFAQTGSRLGDGWPGMRSYASDTPHYMGQFPALAFALHRGHLKESPPAAERFVNKAELFSGISPVLQDYYNGTELQKAPGGTPAEVFAMGRVTLNFKEGEDRAVDFDQFWKKPEKTIHSVTGELVWDYGKERVQVRGPKTQALLGRFEGTSTDLPSVRVSDVKTPMMSLIFTPLDDQPLASSKRILITAMARDKQTGAHYSADGTKLLVTGTAPLLMEPVQATLKFAGVKPVSVLPCDHYGLPISGKTVPIASDGSMTIDGTFRAYYYEVKR